MKWSDIFESVMMTIGVVLTIVGIATFIVPDKESDEIKVENILRITKQLPHSPLRNNLLSVIAAEYGGVSNDLYILVNEFNKIQIENLQK
jgi:hypothetical protein